MRGRFPKEMPAAAWIAIAVTLIALFSGVDYLTGSQLQFSLFYFIPIGLLAWYVSTELSFAAAVVSAVVWWVVDAAGGRSYSMAWIGAANYMLRLASFIVIGLVVSWLRLARDREHQLNEQLERTIADLKSSLAELNELRSHIQKVCAWTNRIESEGKWIPMDEFLAKRLHLTISHGISDEAAQEFLSDKPRADNPPTAPPE